MLAVDPVNIKPDYTITKMLSIELVKEENGNEYIKVLFKADIDLYSDNIPQYFTFDIGSKFASGSLFEMINGRLFEIIGARSSPGLPINIEFSGIEVTNDGFPKAIRVDINDNKF